MGTEGESKEAITYIHGYSLEFKVFIAFKRILLTLLKAKVIKRSGVIHYLSYSNMIKSGKHRMNNKSLRSY